MQVSSINPSFGNNQQSFADMSIREKLLNMSEKDVQNLALSDAQHSVNTKKSRKVTNALFYSAPIVAGLGTALLSESGKTKIFSTQLNGVAGRMAKGLKNAALFTAVLGALDLFTFVTNKLINKLENVKEFKKEHSLLSFATLLAAGFGIMALIPKSGSLFKNVNAPKFLQNGTKRVAKFINTNGTMVKAKNGLVKLADKTPVSLKNIGSVMLEWSPTALMLGGLFNSINASGALNREYNKNYSDLKALQMRAAEDKIADLSAEKIDLGNQLADALEQSDK